MTVLHDWIKMAGNPHILPGDTTSWGVAHGATVYFPEGEDGYKYWQIYINVKSLDPIWEVLNLVRSNDGLNWTEDGVTNPIADDGSGEMIVDPHFIKVGATWMLYAYRGIDLYRYTSADGLTWTPDVAACDLDGLATLCPTVIYKDGVYHMWVMTTSFVDHKLAYLTSNDSVTFTSHVSNPVFDPSDTLQLWHSGVCYYGNTYHLYWEGYDAPGPTRLQLATSPDGVNWTEKGIVMSTNDQYWESDRIADPKVLVDQHGNVTPVYGAVRMYYTGATAVASRMGMAQSMLTGYANLIEEPCIDGDVYDTEGAYNTWAQMRAKPGTGFSEVATKGRVYYQGNVTNPYWYSMGRSIILFDIAPPAGAIELIWAVLSLRTYDRLNQTGGDPTVNIYESDPISDVALEAADYANLEDTPLSDEVTYVGFAVDHERYVRFPMNVDGLAVIPLSGYARLGAREQKHEALNVEPPIPTGDNGDALRWHSADAAGGYRPVLEMNYRLPGGAPEEVVPSQAAKLIAGKLI